MSFLGWLLGSKADVETAVTTTPAVEDEPMPQLETQVETEIQPEAKTIVDISSIPQIYHDMFDMEFIKYFAQKISDESEETFVFRSTEYDAEDHNDLITQFAIWQSIDPVQLQIEKDGQLAKQLETAPEPVSFDYRSHNEDEDDEDEDEKSESESESESGSDLSDTDSEEEEEEEEEENEIEEEPQIRIPTQLPQDLGVQDLSVAQTETETETEIESKQEPESDSGRELSEIVVVPSIELVEFESIESIEPTEPIESSQETGIESTQPESIQV